MDFEVNFAKLSGIILKIAVLVKVVITIGDGCYLVFVESYLNFKIT